MHFIKKLAQYTSVLLPIFLLCGSGCGEVKPLKLNERPEVISIAETMTQYSAVLKLKDILSSYEYPYKVEYEVTLNSISRSSTIEVLVENQVVLEKTYVRGHLVDVKTYGPPSHELRKVEFEARYSKIHEVRISKSMAREIFPKGYENYEWLWLVSLHEVDKASTKFAKFLFPDSIVAQERVCFFVEDRHLNEVLAALYALCPKLQ